MKNQRGTTFMETVIALGILGIILSTSMTILYLLTQQMTSAETASDRDRVFANVVAQIRAQAALQLVNFAPPSVLTDDILQVSNLPLAWSESFFGSVADCTDCPGRAGYVIRPIDGLSGVYTVTVRLYNIKTNFIYPDMKFVMVAR